MICVSIASTTLAEMKLAVEDYSLVELRLDSLERPAEAPVADLIARCKDRCIVTCRPVAEKLDERARESLLCEAAECGAAYIDVELDTFPRLKSRLVPIAQRNGTKIIVSYHNFSETPDTESLAQIVAKAFSDGAQLVKIATMVRRYEDNLRLLALLLYRKNIIVAGMGPAGTISRILAPSLGAPFTFAAPDNGSLTAPGQLRYTQHLALSKTMIENSLLPSEVAV